MKDALKELSEQQIDFICDECHLTKEALLKMDDDTLYAFVYDVMCDIECDETPADDSPMTEHCEMASAIVTVLGNAIAEDEGWDEEDED